MYYKCDMREFVLEEYVHRAPDVVGRMNYWTFQEILNLEAIADTPSFIFLWINTMVWIFEQGRLCPKKGADT
ncbi:hypothetical protein MKW98_004180 [Papaver atlanticum]|uniref:Uncharacterized protein n=1 Tax=Papaver atlanticum TaxID=357466 RepID=A0AAD4XTE7_9MAGN|nr:hypothetical protein MKW98_004180 [Papaver atlanticum]